ncbi:acid phosphatase [Bisporella sp. PMI_857]|nr:acid phosphatase [Bisporella sp. PMI_857]
MNQIQVVGTHNSYHREVGPKERDAFETLMANPDNYYYSHPSFEIQAEHQAVRSFELDIFADPDGGKYATPLVRKLAGLPFESDPALNQSGIKVLHISDADVGTICHTLVECLKLIKAWSNKNPEHVPLTSMVEFKTAGADMAYLGGATPIQWNTSELMASLDAEFRSVFSANELITPDDIRRDNLTLEESVLKYGWPELESARGRIMFLMDNTGVPHDTYVAGFPSAEGRVIFPNSSPGQPDCAFQKLNNPLGDANLKNIQEQVRKGYWVRTRSDEPIATVTSNDTTSMRDAAFASGAQIVSTDFQGWGMAARYGVDYVVNLPNGASAICNSINAPKGCDRLVLEKLSKK